MKMVFCFVSCCFVNCYLIDYAGLLDRRRMIILILLLIATVFSAGNTIMPDYFVESCHSIELSECKKFNHSTIPGLDYDEINRMFNDIDSLFNSGCSDYIQLLVCFLLEPTCHEHPYNMSGMIMTFRFAAYPCKRFCEAIQRECYCHGAYWMSALNCSQLPDGDACFIPPEYTDENGTSNDTTGAWRSCTTTGPTTTDISKVNVTSAPVHECRGHLVYYPGVTYGGEENCAAPCHYMYEEDRFSTELVTALFVLWSVLSALALVSFVSFLLTWKHYSHIEQPYVFLALCHFFVFVAFLIRLGEGHDGMVCDEHHRDVNDTALVTEDDSNGSCTVVFIIVYYSILAISVWLVNLSIALSTRALTKWKHQLQMYYHLSGWGIPLIFVIAAFSVQRMVSGENLLGMCQLDDQYLVMAFGPVMVCILLSFILLLFAVIQMVFCSQVYVEVEHKHRGRFIRSLLFGVIVLIELSIIAVLYLVEYVTYENTESYYTECVEPRKAPASNCSRIIAEPYIIPILRYSLISLVGAISIAWPLFRRVTWTSWKDSITLLYQKIINSFSHCRHLRSNSTGMVQMATLETTV